MEVIKNHTTGEPDLMLYLTSPKRGDKKELEDLVPSGEVADGAVRDRAKSE